VCVCVVCVYGVCVCGVCLFVCVFDMRAGVCVISVVVCVYGV